MEECLICQERLEYLPEDVMMECAICRKRELSKTRCVRGHYVCSDCHTQGMDSIFGLCLGETSQNPLHILEKMMAMPFCHMHGPEHHVLVGASVLVAFHNAGGKLDLQRALLEMQRRGRQVPGGICGLWGSCGAAGSTGICLSIITGSSPLSTETWGWGNEMPSRVRARAAKIGGPRCCKRIGRIAVLEAIDFIREKFGVELEKSEDVACAWIGQNNQCIMERCPFYR